jgi:thioredoxin 1
LNKATSSQQEEDSGFIPHRLGMPEAINSDSFTEDVLESAVPVLVEFWAARCSRCRRLAHDLARVARENTGNIRVFTLNVDEELPAAVAHDVRQIPAVLLFENGQETGRLVGEVAYEEIAQLVAGCW